MNRAFSQLSAEIRVIGMPVALSQLVLTAAAGAMLVNDRGREPFVALGGVPYSISTPTNSAALVLSVLVTWWGAVVVPMGVASGWASTLEHDVDTPRRLLEPSLSSRLASACAGVAAMTVLGAGVFGACVILAAQGLADGGNEALVEFRHNLLWPVPTMFAFWWSFSMALATVTRNAAVVAVAPAALAMASLASSRLGWTASFLPTTWLARTVGAGAEGNSLSSVWADGGGALDTRWVSHGSSYLPLLGCSVLFLAITWRLSDAV